MRSGFGSLRAAVLAGALLASACSPATPDAGATATTPTAATSPTSTANATPTPTPSPTGSTLGPVGTIAFQDGKVWLVTPEGDYTMNIPQGYEVKSSPAGSDTPPEIYAPGSDGPVMSFVYLDEFSALPSRDSVLLSVGSGYHNDPQLREDIREFGGRPAIAVQARTFADTYALISLSAEIGGSFWTFNFFGVDLGETEQLLRQASDSLTKQP